MLGPRVMGRLVAVISCLLVLAACFGRDPAAAQEPRPAPLFAGKALPKPPRATEPWSPPKSKLPDAWNDVVRDLLDHGFADPRGLEYREIEVTVGSVWMNIGRVATTHGWLLPAANGDSPDSPRFAVAWNGLVYPVTRVGKPADWRRDAAVVDLPKDLRYERNSEVVAVAHEGTSLIKGCLLSVLGEAALAERHLAEKVHASVDVYQAAAGAWAWVLFDRALCARLRGDDVVSLESARLLVAWRDWVEAELPKRGVKARKRDDGTLAPFLDFLQPLDDMLADQERRVAAGPVRRVLDPATPKIENAAERIAALIRDLETVDVTQHGQPGGVDATWHPLVEALAKEGDAAVEPLLKCLESDRRLTRSFGFDRDFGQYRYLIGVQEPVFGVFRRMFDTISFGPNAKYPIRGDQVPADPGTCALAAGEIRAYWKKSRGLSEAERRYAVLIDDKATEEQWLEAAKWITASTLKEWPRIAPESENTDAAVRDVWNPLAGESLRSKSNPSVAELLAGRSDQLTTRDLNSTLRLHHLGNACDLALNLARWDRKVALPTLESRIQDCRRLTYDKFYGGYAVDHFAALLPMMVMVGVESGKPQLMDEYVAWLGDVRTDRVHASRSLWSMLRPLARHHREPAMRKAAEKIFGEGSPWLDRPESVGLFDLYGSPLVCIPAFRELLKRRLADRGPFGTATLDANGTSIDVRSKFGGIGRQVAPPLDLEDPRHRQPFPVRIADLVAWRIGMIGGAPSFQLYWPEAERDAQITKIVAFLDAYGNAYGERSFLNPPWSFAHEFGLPTAEFHLAKPTKAAGPEDVRNGSAIFSLESAKARPVALKSFPQPARWTPPAGKQADRAASKPNVVDGRVWQAEEVEVDGQLRQYYGFVARHFVGRVAAEEIELVEPAAKAP